MASHPNQSRGTLSRRSSAQSLRASLLPPLSIPSRSRSPSLAKAQAAAAQPLGGLDGTTGSPPEEPGAKDRPTMARQDSFSLHLPARGTGNRLRARSVTAAAAVTGGFNTPTTTTIDPIPDPLAPPAPVASSSGERYNRSPRWETKALASVGEASGLDVDAYSLESRISIDEGSRPRASTQPRRPDGGATGYGGSSVGSMTSTSSVESSPPSTPRFTILPPMVDGLSTLGLGLARGLAVFWNPQSKAKTVDRLVFEAPEAEANSRRSLDSIDRVHRSRSRTLDELMELRQGVAKRQQGRQGLPLWKGRPSAAGGVVSPITEESSPSPSRPSFDASSVFHHRPPLHRQASSPETVTLPTLGHRVSSAAVPTTTSPYPIHSLHSLLPRLTFLALSFALSFLLIAYLLSTIPHLSLPTSVASIRDQISNLRSYAASSRPAYTHLLLVLSIVFVWKQAFSIPGSALVNVLIGSVYGTWTGTLFTCLLTACGSTVAYGMAKLARPVVETYMPKPLALTQRALDRFAVDSTGRPDGRKEYDRAELTSYLLLARLLPVLPYAVLNVAAGVLDVPVTPFFWTLVFGSFPYNFCTTQVGDLLSLATDSDDLGGIWSFSLLLKLAFVSLLGVVPVMFKSQLRALISSSLSSTSASSAVQGAGFEGEVTEEALEREAPLMDNIGRRGREWVTTGGAHRRSGEYERIPMDVVAATSATESAAPATPPPAMRRTSGIEDVVVASGYEGGQGTSPNAWKRQLKRVSWKRLSASLGTFDPFAGQLTKAGRAGGISFFEDDQDAPGMALAGAVARRTGWSPRKKASVVGGTAAIGGPAVELAYQQQYPPRR